MHSKILECKTLEYKIECKMSTSKVKVGKKGRETGSEKILCCDGKL